MGVEAYIEYFSAMSFREKIIMGLQHFKKNYKLTVHKYRHKMLLVDAAFSEVMILSLLRPKRSDAIFFHLAP